jgi:hypothetical protein
MKKKEYKKIKELKIIHKEFSKINYLGVNLWPVLTLPIYQFYQHNYLMKVSLPEITIKRILGFLFMKQTFEISNNQKGRILTSLFMGEGSNHTELHKLYLNSFKENELIKIHLKTKRFSLGNLKALLKLYKLFKNKGLKNAFKDKKSFFYFLLLTYYNFKQIETLKKLIKDLAPRAYISFACPSNKHESILTQLVKKQGGATFNLQHGSVEEWPMFFHFERVTYEAMISDYLLAWGERSRKICSNHIDPKKITLVGNPRYPKEIKKKGENNMKEGIFFLSIKDFRKNNQEILDILHKFLTKNPTVRIRIKAHPGDSLDFYNFKHDQMSPAIEGSEIPALLASSDFVVVYNSTVMIEALGYGLPIFQFQNKYPERDGPISFGKFNDLREFSAFFKECLPKKKRKILSEKYNKIYLDSFFQPKEKTIPEHFREKILEKSKKK